MGPRRDRRGESRSATIQDPSPSLPPTHAGCRTLRVVGVACSTSRLSGSVAEACAGRSAGECTQDPDALTRGPACIGMVPPCGVRSVRERGHRCGPPSPRRRAASRGARGVDEARCDGLAVARSCAPGLLDRMQAAGRFASRVALEARHRARAHRHASTRRTMAGPRRPPRRERKPDEGQHSVVRAWSRWSHVIRRTRRRRRSPARALALEATRWRSRALRILAANVIRRRSSPHRRAQVPPHRGPAHAPTATNAPCNAVSQSCGALAPRASRCPRFADLRQIISATLHTSSLLHAGPNDADQGAAK